MPRIERSVEKKRLNGRLRYDELRLPRANSSARYERSADNREVLGSNPSWPIRVSTRPLAGGTRWPNSRRRFIGSSSGTDTSGGESTRRPDNLTYLVPHTHGSDATAPKSLPEWYNSSSIGRGDIHGESRRRADPVRSSVESAARSGLRPRCVGVRRRVPCVGRTGGRRSVVPRGSGPPPAVGGSTIGS